MIRILFIFMSVILLFSCASRTTKRDSKGKLLGDISFGDYFYEKFMSRKERAKRKKEEDAKKLKKSKDKKKYSHISNKDKKNKDNKDKNNNSNMQKTNPNNQNSKKTNTKYENNNDKVNAQNNPGINENTNKTEQTKSMKIAKDSDNSQKHTTESSANSRKFDNKNEMNSKNISNTNKNDERANKKVANSKELSANSKIKQIEKSQSKPTIDTSPITLNTYKFTLKKGNRLKGFNTINTKGKDYHLVQSPFPNSKKYFFLSDRKLDGGNKMGLLEIMTADAKFADSENKEVFSNPQHINLKEFTKGNKLGFALFSNPSTGKLEIYYSNSGTLYKATSDDGTKFSKPKILKNLNSTRLDRDPSISPDGKTMVFASSRNLKSSHQGVELFVCFRDDISKEFSNPIYIPDTNNSANELFPSIYQSSIGTFAFFIKYSKIGQSYKRILYSMEIKDKTIYPIVEFSKGSDIPYKYITVSYAEIKGMRIMSSFPVNGYDIFRMFLTKKEPFDIKIKDRSKLIKQK